ncbi:MAG: hypothetical protein ABI868_20645 [Acidobacteriota bacterium]
MNTVAVTRGDVVDAIAATGTLQAVNTVQVGSQVSGTIQSATLALGITDGINTELVSGDLQPGAALATGVTVDAPAAARAGATANPLLGSQRGGGPGRGL